MIAETDRYIENAIAWALNHLGDKGYATRCLAFVEDAYERSNGIEVFGGDCAAESAEIYAARNNAGEPPRGAFAFYDCSGKLFDKYKNWGHVGLCMGEGQVIHAWDQVRIDDYRGLESLPAPQGWTRMTYAGWSPVERIMQGYRKRVNS